MRPFAAVLMLLVVACETATPPPQVRPIAAVPDAAVYAAWIEGSPDAWGFWIADVDRPEPVELARIDATRIDLMSLADDGRYAVAMTSESTDPNVYYQQRVWTFDLVTRRAHESSTPVTFVYEVGADATSPWLVGSTFREDYGRARALFAKLRSNDPGCHLAAAQTFRWRNGSWRLEKSLSAPDCTATTGQVVSLSMELPSAYERLVPGPRSRELRRWRIRFEEQRFLLLDEDRELFRREKATDAALWAKPIVVDLMLEPE